MFKTLLIRDCESSRCLKHMLKASLEISCDSEYRSMSITITNFAPTGAGAFSGLICPHVAQRTLPSTRIGVGSAANPKPRVFFKFLLLFFSILLLL